MNLSFTFRNLEANDALKDYAREKLDRIHKFFPDPIKVHVVYSQQRGYLYGADVQITLSNGLLVKGVEASEDFYTAVDLVMNKIERQLRRFKDRIRDHKPHAGPERSRSVLHKVVAFELPPNGESTAAQTDTGAVSGAAAQTAAPDKTEKAAASSATPRVIKEEKFVAQPMTVEEAIMRMNLLHERFLCFNNVETHQVNVVYQRDDGMYGLIETTHEGNGATAAR